MPDFRRRVRAARTCLSVIALTILAACAIRIEPAQDPRLIAELEALALDTQTLFAEAGEFSANGQDARDPVYARLSARAAAIRLFAEARPAPSGPVSDRIRGATQPAEDRIVELIGRAPSGQGDRDLSNATAAFMSDYLDTLDRLQRRDRASEGRLPESIVLLARMGLEDALRDALFYERAILNRDR